MSSQRHMPFFCSLCTFSSHCKSAGKLPSPDTSIIVKLSYVNESVCVSSTLLTLSKSPVLHI